MEDDYFQKYVDRAVTDFKGHVATVETAGGLTVVTWKRPNEWAYAMRLVFDDAARAVYLTGDLGAAVIRPTCACTVEGLATCFTQRTRDGRVDANPRYFVEKLEATTDRYRYDLDDVLADLQEYLDDYRKEHEEKVEEAREAWEADHPDDEEEFDEDAFNDDEDWEDISEENLADSLGECFFDEYGIVPSGDAYELLQKLGVEGEDIAGLGKRYHVRIALWLVAFRLIAEQLQEKSHGTPDSQ